MNVIGSRPNGWWKDRRRAMAELVRLLEQWASAQGGQVTVVFEKPLSPPLFSSVVEIAQAPRGAADSADDEIVRLIRADEHQHEIIVVTSDLTLAQRVHALGAATRSAAGFRRLIEPEPARPAGGHLVDRRNARRR